jgi:hypothetical protein
MHFQSSTDFLKIKFKQACCLDFYFQPSRAYLEYFSYFMQYHSFQSENNVRTIKIITYKTVILFNHLKDIKR